MQRYHEKTHAMKRILKHRVSLDQKVAKYLREEARSLDPPKQEEEKIIDMATTLRTEEILNIIEKEIKKLERFLKNKKCKSYKENYELWAYTCGYLKGLKEKILLIDSDKKKGGELNSSQPFKE